MLLKEKNILVTGGSRGLGRAFCVTFAREGANVAFNYASDDGSAVETLNEAKTFGEIAKMVAFLVGKKNTDLTGQAVVLDGGL